MGCSLAYYLTLRGGTDVVLLERKRLTSAAGSSANSVQLVKQERIDPVVLAPYMQVQSDDLCCQKMSGRIMNIHHSFLPSFKRARPYHQAPPHEVLTRGQACRSNRALRHARLDEGQNFEQGTLHVHHSLTSDDLSAIGSNVEAPVLSPAVKFHAENRIRIHDDLTITFR